jgi:hypothetical protein
MAEIQQLSYRQSGPTQGRLRAASLPGEHLIEEWPTSRTSSAPVRKGVHFAEISSLHLYKKCTPVNDLYYSSSERSFISNRDTVQEAVRIRRLLRNGIAAIGADIPTLAQCGLIHDELVGLEHLVLSKVPKKISKIRKHHSRVVLAEQRKQQASCQEDPSHLAKVSLSLSQKSAIQARRRAAVAWNAANVK